MIHYRQFLNSDPPKLVELWHASKLGRGAASGMRPDVLDALVLAQPYFDRTGLILAFDEGNIVGCVHAGFGCNAEQTDISPSEGVISTVMVRPEYRRQGIGRELVHRAEQYLQEAGTTRVTAGEAEPRDPFYFGLYGGAQPTGFLESDPIAAPFIESLGYTESERHLVLHRDLTDPQDPTDFRLAKIRRETKLLFVDQPESPTWWWFARIGRLDSIQFSLSPKAGGEPLAAVTIVGLDLYVASWQRRAVGLTDLIASEEALTNGAVTALLIEVGRRLRRENISLLEIHAPEKNSDMLAAIGAARFAPADVGFVYQRTLG